MAKATTIEKPEAPPAPAEAEEEFEAVLPEAEDSPRAESDEPEPEPEPGKPKAAPAKAKAEPEPKPKKAAPKAEAEEVVEAEPEPEAKPKAEPLSPAAREERAKRKMYARKWETALSERDAALAEIDRLKGSVATPAQKQYLADLRKQADEADSMGKLFELSVQEMDRRERLFGERLVQLEYSNKIALSQMNARILHADYDKVLQKAGIYDAIKVDGEGNWKDPEMGRRIYFTRDGKLRADPAEEAYQLALGKLEYEAGLKEEAEPAEPEVPGKPALKVVPKAKAKAKAEPEAEEEAEGTEAEAERRGAQKVIDQVVANQNRPRGIRNLRSAGTPGTARFTRTQLDALRDADPEGYEALLKKNKELERFHLGG